MSRIKRIKFKNINDLDWKKLHRLIYDNFPPIGWKISLIITKKKKYYYLTVSDYLTFTSYPILSKNEDYLDIVNDLNNIPGFPEDYLDSQWQQSRYFNLIKKDNLSEKDEKYLEKLYSIAVWNYVYDIIPDIVNEIEKIIENL